MKNLQRIVLAVIASAITLQAQAGMSEYAAQVKTFAYNHSGKIAIGVGLAIIAGGAYYYMRSQKTHANIAASSNKESKLEPIPCSYQEGLDSNTLGVFQRVRNANRESQRFTYDEETKLLNQIRNQETALAQLESKDKLWIGQAADIIRICLQHRAQVSESARKQMYALFKRVCDDLVTENFIFEENLYAELNTLKVKCDNAFDGYRGDDFDSTIPTVYEEIETAANNIVQIVRNEMEIS